MTLLPASDRASISASPAFEEVARGAQFRDRIVVRVNAPPEAIFRAARDVTLSEMKLARLVGELRYLPSRLAGHPPPGHRGKSFLSMLITGGTLMLADDTPHELITGSAGQLHRILDQAPARFESRQAFDRFNDPGYEKLFMSLRVQPTEVAGEYWLVLEHATEALSADAGHKFHRYWLFIKPGGAFVSRQLLKAIRHRAQDAAVATDVLTTSAALGRSVRATCLEATKPLPGDDLLVDAKGSLTHAITIQRAPCDVWPWLAQMGAGSRAGWYSYDFLDNQGQPSASRIVPELQRLSIGMLFPALPGATDGFTLLAFKPNRFIVIGWPSPAGGAPLMTWAFVLEDAPIGSTRLVVRARVGADYGFHKLPWWIGKPVTRVVHFVMQRKQLLGIARRAERFAGDPAATTPPVESSHERNAAA